MLTNILLIGVLICFISLLMRPTTSPTRFNDLELRVDDLDEKMRRVWDEEGYSNKPPYYPTDEELDEIRKEKYEKEKRR